MLGIKRKREERKKEKLLNLVDMNYRKGLVLTYKLHESSLDKDSTVILNYLNRLIPEPVGYDDEDLYDKVEGISRFDGVTIDLAPEKIIFKGSDLYLDLGLSWRPFWLELDGFCPDAYLVGYVNKLKEAGYSLKLSLESGPYKVYDSIHNEIKIVDYTLRMYLTLTPLVVESSVQYL